ncbi:MAG: helix-turn-helix transcriptional regulator, partial [Sutterella wadsworthensis]|nr:helix-turn-helix transcriptional regulator [Sutterella wadsworthensis]
MSNPSLSISSLVFFRKNAGLTQADIATAMSITQSAVARLEKRLLSDADVTLKTL